jgi:hypothetical protein
VGGGGNSRVIGNIIIRSGTAPLQTLTSHSGRHLIDKTEPTQREGKGRGKNLIDQCHEPVNEIVAEPEFTIQTSESQFVFPPANGEILTGQVKVASSLNYLPAGRQFFRKRKDRNETKTSMSMLARLILFPFNGRSMQAATFQGEWITVHEIRQLAHSKQI